MVESAEAALKADVREVETGAINRVD
jgi:hypothetical protein